MLRTTSTGAVGNGMEGIQVIIVLIRVCENRILRCCVFAGITVVEKVGRIIGVDQVVYPDDAVFQGIIELGRVVQPIVQRNLVRPAA